MKKITTFFSIQFLIITSLFASLPTLDKEWQFVGKENDITVHKKEIPNNSLVAFRGETVMDAPIAKIANVLMDTSRKLEWVAKIVEAKDVLDISPFERIEYNHTASGFFLVKDRDFVFRAKASIDRKNKRLTYHLKSEETPLMPQTPCVRGELTESRYILTSLDNDRKTHVVVEIQADPKGYVPKWLVNLFQKSWPKTTLEGIRRQAQRPDVPENATVKTAIFN